MSAVVLTTLISVIVLAVCSFCFIFGKKIINKICDEYQEDKDE
jgi:hypothetical protein